VPFNQSLLFLAPWRRRQNANEMHNIVLLRSADPASSIHPQLRSIKQALTPDATETLSDTRFY